LLARDVTVEKTIKLWRNFVVFKYIQDEIKRRALKNQAGTEFDEEIKNVANASLKRVGREAKWRQLRRKTYFDTVTSYTSGTGYMAVTQSSSTFTLSTTAGSFWTDKIEVGRKINFGTSSWNYTIRTLSTATSGTIDVLYRGTTSTATTYEIYPQEEYNLPVQVDHRCILWHEDYGYPFRMHYIPDQTFFDAGVNLTEKNTPTHYRMWGENSAMAQPTTATPLTITLSSTTDAAVEVTIAGKVAGYPRYEKVVVSTGTTSNTAYEFESVEMTSKDSNTAGTITITGSRSGYTVAVLPAGDTTANIKYSKVQIYPLPNRVFPINVFYYKDTYKMVNDDDIHELGENFNEAIILLSVAKFKYQDSQAEGDKWKDMYDDEIASLKKTNVDKIDWLPILERPNQGRTDPFVTKGLLYRQAGGSYGPASRR
jgi:hypothetical protein